MRFDEHLHWNDGLFLQPHHLQNFQRLCSKFSRNDRSFLFPYPYGLIDFEIDQEALKNARVVVKRFSAVMPDGTEISMPGNTVVHPLDLGQTLKEHPEDLTVYLAIPLWAEYEANLAEDKAASLKRLYSVQERQMRDENTGDNEITVATRTVNARLITNLDDMTDMQVLPIAKLITVVGSDNADPTPVLNEKYIPPFMLLTSDCSLFSQAMGLLFDVHRCCDKILNELTVAQFKPENFSGINAFNILQLRVLSLYDNRLSALLSLGRLSPFDLYLELRSFLAELIGLHPMNEIKEIQNYDHKNCAVAFSEMMNDIRSLIVTEGSASYRRLEFAPVDNGMYMFAKMDVDFLLKADAFYLAVSCDVEDRDVIAMLEKGDNFKLINPNAKTLRARGVKLMEIRYPPRFLPALNNTLWFKLQTAESPRTWQMICEEQGVLIDYAQDLFPKLEASLFATMVSGK